MKKTPFHQEVVQLVKNVRLVKFLKEDLKPAQTALLEPDTPPVTNVYPAQRVVIALHLAFVRLVRPVK